MNENNSNSTGKLILKIVVPILLICAVVGIWAVKTVQKTKDSTDDTTIAQIDNSGNSDSNSNPDFAYSVTDELNLDKLKSYKLPIIIDFGAEWCNPCRQLAPIMEGLNRELRGRAIIKFVNTESGLDIINNYDFQSIPMQVFINSEGNPYEHSSSLYWESKYDQETNKLLYTMHTGTLTKEELMSILTEMGMK